MLMPIFELCVEHNMRVSNNSYAKAEEIERSNLGYWAGYFDNKTRARVERLFECAHPVFGAIDKVGAPTLEEAFQMGQDYATRRLKKRRDPK